MVNFNINLDFLIPLGFEDKVASWQRKINAFLNDASNGFSFMKWKFASSMILQNPKDFDHTIGCYISDYILGCWLLTIFLMSLQSYVPENSSLNILVQLNTLCTMYSSFAGGFVHQYFDVLQIKNVFSWSALWNSISFMQLIASLSVVLVLFFYDPHTKCLSKNISNFTIKLIFFILTPVFFYLTFFCSDQNLFDRELLLIAGAFIVGFIRFVFLLILNRRRFDRRIIAYVLISVIFYAAGVVLRELNFTISSEYFNKNVVFHLCIGLSSMFFSIGLLL